MEILANVVLFSTLVFLFSTVLINPNKGGKGNIVVVAMFFLQLTMSVCLAISVIFSSA